MKTLLAPISKTAFANDRLCDLNYNVVSGVEFIKILRNFENFIKFFPLTLSIHLKSYL